MALSTFQPSHACTAALLACMQGNYTLKVHRLGEFHPQMRLSKVHEGQDIEDPLYGNVGGAAEKVSCLRIPGLRIGIAPRKLCLECAQHAQLASLGSSAVCLSACMHCFAMSFRSRLGSEARQRSGHAQSDDSGTSKYQWCNVATTSFLTS